MKAIEFLRAFVRPYIQFLLSTTIVVLAICLAIKYANAEIARYIVSGVVGAGLILLGEYTGERASKRKEDK